MRYSKCTEDIMMEIEVCLRNRLQTSKSEFVVLRGHTNRLKICYMLAKKNLGDRSHEGFLINEEAKFYDVADCDWDL